MRFFRLFRQRPTRSGPQSAGVRIHSLGDLDGYFPWPDLGMSCRARSEISNPLAVAVRALRVVEYAAATGAEHGDDGMVLLGLSQALHDLARHGEWAAVGTLLNALEIVMSPLDRPTWLASLDPYLKEAQRSSAS